MWELQLRSRTAWNLLGQLLIQFRICNQHLALSSLTQPPSFPVLLQVEIKHKSGGGGDPEGKAGLDS